MIPAIFVLFNLPYWWKDPAACAAFALAGITDSLDGYFARKWGLTSRLGEFLDPVADKLIVATALVLIVSGDPKSWFLVVVAIVIIGREIAVSALREWMAEIGARGRIKVSMWGKIKTIMQIVGLSFWLFRRHVRHPRLQARPGADRDRRRAHLVVHVPVPAAGLAGASRQLAAVTWPRL
jgi:CDP-diacylglycerol--glycerol-3-phosphate 3-phosphatidyltransferase